MHIRRRPPRRWTILGLATLVVPLAAGLWPQASVHTAGLASDALVGSRDLTSEVVTPAPTPSPSSNMAGRESVFQVHTVAPGESLDALAARYSLTLATLLRANNLPQPDELHVGQQLRIPEADGVLYVVQPGDTLASIAESHGVDTRTVIAVNHLEAAPDVLAVGSEILVPGAGPIAPAEAIPQTAAESEHSAAALRPTPRAADQAASSGSARTHVVREGDTLHSIAEAAGVDILSLIASNALDDPEVLTPGRELRILAPRPREHIAQAGETLAGIADRYDLGLAALLVANGIDDPDVVAVGTPLILPQPRAEASAVTLLEAAPRTPVPGHQSPTPTPAPAPQTRGPAPSVAPAAPLPTPPAAPEGSSAPTERTLTARVSGYAPGVGASSARTASGTRTHWGTVAADTRLYPFGTRLRIEGFDDMVFVVEDTGSAVRGNVFDIWFPDAAAARRLGSRMRRVTILASGD